MTVSKFAPAHPATTSVTIQSSVESRPLSIGGANNAAVAGINLTSAELARLVTTSTGTVTIGDSGQTGDITLTTATPAATAGAAIVVVQATGGAGGIILDDGSGSGTALNGNGGTVSLTAGTGGIVEAAANTTAANDIAGAPTTSLTSAGPLGTASKSLNLAPASLTTDTSANNSNQYLGSRFRDHDHQSERRHRHHRSDQRRLRPVGKQPGRCPLHASGGCRRHLCPEHV